MSYDDDEVLMGGVDPIEDDDLIDPLEEPADFEDDYEEEDPDKDH